MAPLPCSPVSNSTASEQSHTTDDSDDSLTTPRPGPADPAQRTAANLSRPSVPTYSSSPESPKRSPGPAWPTDGPWERQTEGRPRNPYTYGTSPKQAAEPGADVPLRPPQPERQRSVSFSPQAIEPKRQGSYSMATRRHSPNVSPHAEARSRLSEEGGDSSADESTAIFPRDRIGGTSRNTYGAMAGQHDHDEPDVGATGYDGGQEELVGPKRRKSSRGKSSRTASTRGQEHADAGAEADVDSDQEGWFTRLVEKYGSVELENKGSVARDHLALERTFLAWLRTSLSFASIGIAVTQLFRLNTSIQNTDSASAHGQQTTAALSSQADPRSRLRHVGKPLGATFLGISILILLIGFHRYFESQHYVIRGKFPASRGSIVLVSTVACALIVTSLVVVIVLAPSVK